MELEQEVRRTFPQRARGTCGDREVEEEPAGDHLLVELDDRVEIRGGLRDEVAEAALADPRRLDLHLLHGRLNAGRLEEQDGKSILEARGGESLPCLGAS